MMTKKNIKATKTATTKATKTATVKANKEAVKAIDGIDTKKVLAVVEKLNKRVNVDTDILDTDLGIDNAIEDNDTNALDILDMSSSLNKHQEELREFDIRDYSLFSEADKHAHDETRFLVNEIEFADRKLESDPKKIQTMMSSIKKQGVLEPFIVDADGRVMGGRHRLMAVRELQRINTIARRADTSISKMTCKIKVRVFVNFRIKDKTFFEVSSFMSQLNKRAKDGAKEVAERITLCQQHYSDGKTPTEICEAMSEGKDFVSRALSVDMNNVGIKALVQSKVALKTLAIVSKWAKAQDPVKEMVDGKEKTIQVVIPAVIMEASQVSENELKLVLEDIKKKKELQAVKDRIAKLMGSDNQYEIEFDRSVFDQWYSDTVEAYDATGGADDTVTAVLDMMKKCYKIDELSIDQRKKNDLIALDKNKEMLNNLNKELDDKIAKEKAVK